MSTAISIGQAAGFGVAAGLLLLAISGLVARRLPSNAAIAIAAVAGALAGAAWLIDDISIAGAAVGALGGALATLGLGPLAQAAARAGSALATSVILALSSLASAAASWVPFVGFVLIVAAAFLALRSRRKASERYEGLRILR